MTLPVRPWLSIEASNPSASPVDVCVGVRRAGGEVEVLGRHAGDEADRASDGVMLAVDKACRAAGVGPRGLGGIAVSLGPGGFTSLRIATATAKVLADTLGVAVVGVPTAAVAAVALGAADRPALVALAGKLGAAHLTLVRADGGLEDLGIRGPEGVPSGAAALVCDDHVPEGVAARAAGLGMRRVRIALSAPACLEAAARYEAVDPARLGPIYAREPDAVTQWRARHGPKG